MKLPPARHETRAEHGQNLTKVRQGFRLHPPQHQRIAHALHLNILRAIHKTQFLGDAHRQRIAAFEDSGQHEVTPKI